MAGAIAGQVFDFEVANFAALPTDNDPLTEGRLVRAADTGIVYRDNGASWDVWSTSLQLGTTGTTAAAGNDSRLSDARTPTAHATSHKMGGSDAIRLDELAVPTADVSLNSHKITGLATPTAANDAANKSYVDGAIQGLKYKEPVRVATTANGALATAYENGDTVDGVVLATGDRVLLKNQTTGSENGIYTVNASGAPTRATDFDADAEVAQAFVFVREGTTLHDTAWVLTNDGAIVVGTTALTFTQFAGVTALTEGSGIDITANVVSVDIASLPTLGVDHAADWLIFYDVSGTALGKAHPDDLGIAGGGAALTVEEVDGSPTDAAVTKIVFPNGTLSFVGHIATYTPTGGGGGTPADVAASLVMAARLFS